VTVHFALDSLECRYDRHVALRIDGLELQAGEVTAIVGPNGAGKSTLIRALAGVLEPAEGVVRLQGVNLARFAEKERARRIAYLPADSRLAWPMLAIRVVDLGRYPWLKPFSRASDEDDAAVADALERAGASSLAGRPFNELSSGEKARVLIARALATRAPALLLDEPAAALDPRHQIAVMEILRQEAARGVCVVFAGHSLELVSRYADRVLVIDRGGIAADGPPQAALGPDTLRQVFGLETPGGIRPPDWRLA
jgi:iron complex transport system ATP-binding protein